MRSADFLIAYEPTDASWAVWVAEILRQSGWFVVLPPEPGAAVADQLIVVYSGRASESTRIRDQIETAQAAGTPVWLILVDDDNVPLPAPPFDQVRLTQPDAPLEVLRACLLGQRRSGELHADLIDPPDPSRAFVNRKPELWTLVQDVSDTASATRRVVTGPPGIGKTALVAAFVRSLPESTYDVRWVSAAGVRLDGLLRWQSRRPVSVLVIDGAVDHSAVARVLPADQRTHVIITSRSDRWPFPVMRLDGLNPRASVDLITREIPGISERDAIAVWRKVGGVPGSLTLAAAAARRRPDVSMLLTELDSLEHTMRYAAEHHEGSYYLNTDDPRLISMFERAFVDIAGGIALGSFNRGSWKRLWHRADRAAEVAALVRPEGEANKSNAEAIALLMHASAATPDVVVCSGSILFVKSTDERGATRVFAKTLTAEELRLFEQQGHLMNTAAQVLDFLRTLRSLPEAGNM